MHTDSVDAIRVCMVTCRSLTVRIRVLSGLLVQLDSIFLYNWSVLPICFSPFICPRLSSSLTLASLRRRRGWHQIAFFLLYCRRILADHRRMYVQLYSDSSCICLVTLATRPPLLKGTLFDYSMLRMETPTPYLGQSMVAHARPVTVREKFAISVQA